MKIRLFALAAVAAVSVLPVIPASATHSCDSELQAICNGQHLIFDKINFLIECKVLHNC